VPRKPKRPVDGEPPQTADSQSANGKSNGAEPKKKLRAAPPPTKKKKAAAPKKSPAKKPATPTTKAALEPTDDEIRLRAYFLAERRQKLSLPGDSAHDWIEARRQLIAEAKR
jgi:Protein of unknown function (DUF2934)